MNARHAGAPVPPAQWHAALRRPALDTAVAGPGRARLARFSDTPAQIEQPALTENILVLHLGGPKEVRRGRGVRTETHELRARAMTLIPAFEANRWHTLGPIDYAHLTFSTGYLAQLAVEEFDRDPRQLALLDHVGFDDPLLFESYTALMASVAGGRADRLLQESLLTVVSLRLLAAHSTLAEGDGAARARPQVRGGLAGWQMRRIVDHVAAHYADEIGIDALAALTGLSRAQFFRAFRQSTGSTPHLYVTQARLERARALLLAGDLSAAEVGVAVGLGGARRFATLFRQATGIHPRLFAAARRG